MTRADHLNKSLFFILLLLTIPVFCLTASDNIPKQKLLIIEFSEDGSSSGLIYESEYSAILDADFQSVIRVLSDLAGASELFPKVKESEVLYESDDFSLRRNFAAYRFLGIGETYEYVERVHTAINTASEFRIESQLVRSVDGKFNEHWGYWHVKREPDLPDGYARTSVTLHSYFDYKNPFFLQDLILRLFGEGEIASMFSCVENAANRL